MSDFASSYPYPTGGGLNLADAPEFIADDEALELVNVRFAGEGRWGPRRAALSVEAGLSNICGIFGMPHGTDNAAGTATGVVYLDYAGGVQLYAADGSGRNAALVGTLAGWESVSQRPKCLAAVAGECLWIVDEAKLYGLTVYDPNDRFGTGQKLFQPKFKFNLDFVDPAAPIRARCVAAYNNFLFVAGYGDEHEPDRPEVLRWSYLGFEADSEGAGDAGLVDAPVFGTPEWDGGVEHAPGSKNLFDLEDASLIGVRGQPIMNMIQGAERLLVLTRFTAHMLFGYDRFSFEDDLLDNQRGLVASRAAGEANGLVWWWSPLGPTVWGGGQPEGLERKITPRVREVHYDSLIFAHQPEEYEARWYHSDDAGDPYLGECYSYLYGKWREEELGVRVFCAGEALPGTILRPGPGGAPVPPPDVEEEDPTLPAPENLTHTEITAHSAKASWTPGIVSPQVVTRIFWKVDGGAYQGGIFQPTLFPQFKVHEALEPLTTYWTKVYHVDQTTGERSAEVEDSFTTLALGELNPPTGLTATLGKFVLNDPFAGNGIIVYVQLRWTPGQAGTFTQIDYKPINGSWENASRFTVGVHATSQTLSGPSAGGFFNLSSGQWVFRVRHTSTFEYDEELAPDGDASDWSDELIVDLGTAQ